MHAFFSKTWYRPLFVFVMDLGLWQTRQSFVRMRRLNKHSYNSIIIHVVNVKVELFMLSRLNSCWIIVDRWIPAPTLYSGEKITLCTIGSFLSGAICYLHLKTPCWKRKDVGKNLDHKKKQRLSLFSRPWNLCEKLKCQDFARRSCTFWLKLPI